jgi:hypothetical protein
MLVPFYVEELMVFSKENGVFMAALLSYAGYR